jgi:hypothetical protein
VLATLHANNCAEPDRIINISARAYAQIFLDLSQYLRAIGAAFDHGVRIQPHRGVGRDQHPHRRIEGRRGAIKERRQKVGPG